MTSYLDIYSMANTELQDPYLKAIYNISKIMFCQSMYNFLENAIPRFTNPKQVKNRLSDRIYPILVSNSFTGDGTTSEFSFSVTPTEDQIPYCIFEYYVNDTSALASYNSTNNIVTFETAPENGATINIKWYYIGVFNTELYYDEKFILSQFLCVSWATYVNNNRLDIDRLLNDTDFKMSSNATTTNSKTYWYTVNREVASKEMNKYAWDAVIRKIYE